jgi:hypothetical protein
MKNAINKQFSMTPGSKEVDTQGTFKNDAAVLNMGTPTNYGTPSGPLNNLDDDPKKKSGRREGESREQYGARVLREANERAAKRKKAKEEGNKPAKRAGDFSFGPVSGNVNRYGEGG